MQSGRGQVAESRVRMVAQPQSVPAVRRFVDDALTTWGCLDLIDDVSLSVTELATNATLHSRSNFFDVELRSDPYAVRVAVVDTGDMSAESIALRADVGHHPDVTGDLDLESMTGRGLFIVSSLASSWGIDDLPGGTRVWADFATGGRPDGDQGAVSSQPLLSGWGRPDPRLEVDTVVIRLDGCPPGLLLAHDDNLADIARELRLYGASHADPEASRSAEEVVEIVLLSALSWDAARVLAKQAARDGRPLVDVAIASNPVELPRRVAVLRRALLRAEAMAEQGLLMTMPAPAAVQEWRDWAEVEMVEQACTGRAPRSFAGHREGLV
ncbi:ATP-binding protein [Nocardioides panacis]|uniref:ATP-binding protein n=1 Tax=Nocardioides panacis TaxID=2849501 RepID=A0A975Y1A0_9ACTN|nr:ATP-binding protein [Nocardioides panacis]QWZ09290.1 ATP-binding protein [Nocardioides panacis]